MDVIAGKYNVVRELGEGAWGKVYLVEHAQLKVPYALKVLQGNYDEDDRFIERFKQEAGSLLRFTHSGSIQLRDFGVTETGQYYMTMDYCDGVLVKQRLVERGRYSVELALETISQILSVLEAAHQAGLVHRDIKPENLMEETNPHGGVTIKVMDFGIAKLVENIQAGPQVSSSGRPAANLTIEGASIGTPQYMSPEQAAGEKDIDARADLYSCGVLLYELLTGAVPFNAESVVKTLLLQITKAPPPLPAELGIPEDVQGIVFKALEKERQARFQTAAEFRQACLQARAKLKNEPAAESAAAAGSAPGAAAGPAAGREAESVALGTHILCLDDDPIILNIVKHVMEKEGYAVDVADSPAELDRYIFERNTALLICDVQMPGMAGTTVCKLLKLSTADLKIILFSNIDERELEQAAQEARADAWMSKTDKPEKWIATVKRVLASK